MFLMIDTIDRNKISFNLNNAKNTSFDTTDQSKDILPALEKFLKSQNCKITDLKAIGVNIGPGSFTGVRVGVSIANTLAWSLNIPVIGFKDGQNADFNLKTVNFSGVALPFYK